MVSVISVLHFKTYYPMSYFTAAHTWMKMSVKYSFVQVDWPILIIISCDSLVFKRVLGTNTNHNKWFMYVRENEQLPALIRSLQIYSSPFQAAK